jgi:PhnB protein
VEITARDVVVTIDGDLAVAHGLQHVRTRTRGGENAAWWSRVTRTFARTPGGWRITHEHDSVPFHMDGSFRAALDLEPWREETTMPEDTMTANRPDAAVMRGVIPYVGYAGRAGEALDFYVRAFGATELGRMPDAEAPDRLMHGQVEINGGAFMATDMGCESAETSGVGTMHMQLVVDDGRRWWDRAVAAGCAVVEPYQRQFWGDDWGLLVDPFGIRWAVLQPGPGPAAQPAAGRA